MACRPTATIVRAPTAIAPVPRMDIGPMTCHRPIRHRGGRSRGGDA